MITGIAHPRLRRDISSEETTQASHTPQVSPLAQAPSAPEVEAIAPASAIRSDLIKGLQITDQRLLLNQYQQLNQDIQALLLRQPTLSSVIEQQLARSLGITPPVDVSSLYVHRYHTDEQGQRTLVSVEGITEALFKALRQLKTSPDAEPSTSTVGMEVGFYRSDSPSESTQQLQTRDTLLSIAQAIEKELPLSLARFWTEPRKGEPNPESPQNELLAIHREMLSTLAALGVEDGALTPAAKSLIDKAFEYPTLEARESAMKDGERPGVYPLKLEVPRPAGSLLAGAFLITSSDGSSATRPFNGANTDRTLLPGQQQGLTVLYTPRDGYETFDSPAKALAALRQRINDDPDAAEQLLLGLPIEVQQDLKGDWKTQLSQNLSPVEADVIAAGVPQLLARQRQQVINTLQALYDPQSVEPELVDPWRHLLTEADLHYAADLGPHFDGSNALEAREEWLDSRSRSIDARQALDQKLGNQKNWRYLAQKLNEFTETLSENPTERDVSAILKKTPMNIAPDSAHYQSYIRAPGLSVSLEAFLIENGLPLPKTRDDLVTLAQTAKARAQQHPLGNFAGGLSWPIPLDSDQQQTLRREAVEHAHSDPELPQEIPKRGALEHLGRNLHLCDQVLADPVKVLETLISSKDGQALGQAMQTKMDGIATDSSANDYALAAIQLMLDPESLTSPQRNHVAGFDLAHKKHWGKKLSTIVSGLRQHLIDTGRESPALAGAAAHLLLSRAAPHLLVKNIPDSVVYGSNAWANLCIAAAAIEANTPGRVATMSYAEVMLTADTAGTAPASAQAATILDWAVANDILPAKDDALYQPADLDKAQTLFKAQLDKLMEASSLIGGSFPRRKQMALDLLLKTFGPGMDFERKIFSKDNENPRSLLEIVMEELVMDGNWKLTEHVTGVDLDAIIAFTKGASFNIKRAFEDAFSTALKNFKTVKKTAILNALSNLPPEDRENLTQGKLNYFQEKSYRISLTPFAGDTLFHTSPVILVTAQHKGKKTTYEFDTAKGVVRSLGNRKTPRAPVTFSDEMIKEEPFYPDKKKAKDVDGWQSLFSLVPGNPVPVGRMDLGDLKESELDRAQPSSAPQPYMLLNPRSHHIADSVIKALELDNPAIKKAAADTTTFESNQETKEAVIEFFLNLIPFRSAIVNFMEGNYAEGITDLAVDVFGFVTAGAGMAAKIGKVVGTAGTAASKALKVAKIMLPPLLKELNPLNGVGDLLKGAGKIVYEGAEAIAGTVGALKGTTNRQALVRAASRYEAAATGTFKVGGNSVEGIAVKRNGRWYAYDAHKQDAFGAPQDFDPVHTLMPPSPKADFSPQGHVSTGPDNRFHPYKKTNTKMPYNNGSTPTKPPIVNKTDHLDSIEGEYIKHFNDASNEAHFTPSRMGPTEERFNQNMDEFHKALDPLNPTNRPVIPDAGDYEEIPSVIEKALDSSDVVIFGENHESLTMFHEIDKCIELFKRKNVKVVGIEGIVYDRAGKIIDDGMGFTGPGHRPAHPEFNLDTLMKKFDAAGIKVVPLDHMYLTRHRHKLGIYKGQSEADRHLQRLKEFNYYATRVIEKHKHEGKVIALVGRQHINTTQGVTGLAEATGGIGIGVYERLGINVGYGTKSMDKQPGPLGTLNAQNDLTGDLQIFTPEP